MTVDVPALLIHPGILFPIQKKVTLPLREILAVIVMGIPLYARTAEAVRKRSTVEDPLTTVGEKVELVAVP